MRAKCRRLAAEHGLHLVIIDYIQLMQGRGRFENRTLELASISRSLKGLAKELSVPIVVLSQLSRAPESRSDHRPQLSDLRESGALEQDADVVVFIYREDMYADKSQPPTDAQGVAELHHRQAAQRPDRHRPARVHPRVHALRESRRPDRRGVVKRRAMIRPTVARVESRRAAGPIIVRIARLHLARDRDGADAGPSRPPGVIAVVKANAYGHGAGQVARALEDAGADLLACADIEEGAALRAAGVRAEILVFGALSVSDLDGLFDCRLTPTISTPGAARAVQAAAAKHKQRLRYHLKIDTGMNRLGFPVRQSAADAARAARQRESRARRGLHAFRDRRRSGVGRCSATSGSVSTVRSAKSPCCAATSTRDRGPRRDAAGLPLGRPWLHAANSAALLRDSRVWYDRVRPGLLLYGLVPPPLASTMASTPVMTLVSRVVAVKGVRAGERRRLRRTIHGGATDDDRDRSRRLRGRPRHATRRPRHRC